MRPSHSRKFRKPTGSELARPTHFLADPDNARRFLEEQVKEGPYTDQVLGYLRGCGFLAAHISDSRKEAAGELVGDSNAAGLPDIIAVHAGRRILLLLELKRVKTKVKPGSAQDLWLTALAALHLSDHESILDYLALPARELPVVISRVLRPTREDWDWLYSVAGGGS